MLVITILRSCIGNWLPQVTLSLIVMSTDNSFVTFPKAGRSLAPTANFQAPLYSHGMPCFSCFAAPPELETEDRETLALLRSLHVEVEQAYELVQQFTQMLRTRTGEQLDTWLEKVRVSQIRELQGFVSGVERDKKAVKAGLTLPQSNGLVEGKVNKLKLIKRMMYGRAAFPLLRQRVLHAL
jgi:transposase